MQRSLIGILALLVSSFLFALPASAAILPQCAPGAFPGEGSDFVLVASDNIIFEPQQPNSGRVIQGNVLVTSSHPVGGTLNNTGVGFVKVGANTTINGTVIADVIILPDGGASIEACIANTIVGSALALSKGSCKNLATPTPAAPGAFTPYAVAHPTCVQAPLGTLVAFSTLCGPTPTEAVCANAAAPLTVVEGGSLTLTSPPDDACYGALVLRKGAVLNLATAGPFSFKSVKMESGSRLIGPVGQATVNVNGKFLTDAGVVITNIDLNIVSAGPGEVATLQKNSVLTSVNINAPFGKCHIWTGTEFTCSEACCKILDVEPIKAECGDDELVPCVCPTGFQFVDNTSRLCERIPE